MNLKKSRVLSIATSLLVMSASIVGLSATAANAASAPVTVTFESNDTSGAALGGSADFGGNSSSVVTSTVGANTSKVGQIINGGECWSGTTFLIKDLGYQLISDTSKIVTLDLYSVDAIADVKLKLEGGATDPAREVDVAHPGGGWKSMSFNFATGPAFAPGNYIKASLFVGFCGTAHPASVLFDNVSFPGATSPDVIIPRTTPSVLVNFESNDSSGYALVPFGGVSASKVTDSVAQGSVGSTAALKLNDGIDCWGGVTFLNAGSKASLISSANPVVKANIYAPAAGLDIKLKLESALGGNKEVDVTSVAGWKTYSFDFSGFDANIDYSIASLFANFTCASGNKGSGDWYADDIAFNGATGAALAGGNTGGGTPVPFTGNATVRLAGMDATNSVNHQSDADYWVSQGWIRGGATYHTKLVPVASTQHLTYVVSNSVNGSPIANATVTLVLGKAYANSTAKVHVGSAVAGGAGTECWCGNSQATATGVTNSQGLVSFDLVSDDVAADAADYPGSNLAVAPTGKNLFSQITAYVTGVLDDSVDVVDFYFYKPATAEVIPQVTSRVNGITTDNAAVGSTEGWAQYYAAGLGYYERGVEVGTTTHLSYTVTANGAPYANKTVHLLLGKQYSGSNAKVSVNGQKYEGAEKVIDFTTDSAGQVSFDVVNTNDPVDADPYQPANTLNDKSGKHLFAQLALVGEKGNQDVIDIIDLVYYKNQSATPPTTYNVRLADWNANNSFDGTHVWGDGGLGSWFPANTGYFAHYVAAGSTFNLRYSVKTAAGVAAPNGTVVTLSLGTAWSGSNAKFTVNGVAVSGMTKWNCCGSQLDQATTTATVSGGYITVPMTALDALEDATVNPGSATANPDGLNPLFMQVKTHVEGNAITNQDWVNIVVTQPAAAPTITSISGTSGKSGQAIDIVGTNLADALGATTVSLYTAATTKVAAITTAVTVIAASSDGTRITVKSPYKTQKGYFKVTTGAGTAVSATAFSSSTSITSKPVITFPSSLVKEVGSTLVLSGTNLGSATSMKIGAVTLPFTVINASSVSVTIPDSVVSGSTLSATNAGGTVATTKLVFQAPVVTTATASGRVGATVTVTGKNLKATAIAFGGNKTAKAIVNDGSTLTFLVPTGALTGAIKITTGGGVVYTNSFTVVPPAPTVDSFTPVTGKKGVAIVTVKGTNLLGATVTVGSVAVTLSAGASATSFKFVIPAGAVTGKINVTTPGGSASSTANLTVTN